MKFNEPEIKVVEMEKKLDVICDSKNGEVDLPLD